MTDTARIARHLALMRVFLVSGGILLAAGVYCFIAGNAPSGGFALFASLAVFGAGAYHRGKANALFKERVVARELAKTFGNLEYKPGEWFSDAWVRRLNLFAAYDRSGGDDYIAGEYRGVHFQQCDMFLEREEEEETVNARGEVTTRTKRVDVFRGRAMRFTLARPFAGEVQVVGRRFAGAAIKGAPGWKRVPTELIDFDETFAVYARDPLHALTVLTPQMILAIFDAAGIVGSSMLVYCNGVSLYMFFSMSRNSFDLGISGSPEKEEERLRRDIELITRFLDTMYFREKTLPGA